MGIIVKINLPSVIANHHTIGRKALHVNHNKIHRPSLHGNRHTDDCQSLHGNGYRIYQPMPIDHHQLAKRCW